MPSEPSQTIIANPPAPPLTLEPVSGPALKPIEVGAGKHAVIGRSSQSSVVLPDESVSRRHACIRPAAGAWFIEDLGSRHGTFLNAVPVIAGQTAPLKRGDLVGIGPWSFRVKIGGGPAADARITTTIDTPGAKSERVERVADRELAQLTRNRLNLLIDVAGALSAAPDESQLAKVVCEAAVRGTGFPRAALLRETGSSHEVRVLCETGPRGTVVDPSLRAESQPAGAPDGSAGGGLDYSRSLIAESRKGEVARLTSEQAMNTTESIMRLGIQTALCAPIMLTSAGVTPVVIGFLYLDARQGEVAPGGLSKQAERRPSAVATVQNDAAAFCLALAKMHALALANISRAELERRQRELERDLEAAHEAQQAIMPPERAEHGRVRYAMRCKSGRYVAGDLFGVVPLEGGKLAVFLGDVAGKGVGAAIFMATAQTHLSVALSADPDPAAAVNAVNRRLSTIGMGSRFISLWLGIIDPAAGTVNYVDAGHGYCLLANSHGAKPVGTLSGGGIPLGIDADGVYTSETITFATGDRLVIFSDGIVEQPAGGDSESETAPVLPTAGAESPSAPANTAGAESAGEQFGMDRAAAALAGSRDPADDVRALFDAVFAHAGTDALADDTTVASVMLV